MDKNTEIALVENTLKLLRRGKYELTGEEAVVFYSCFQYLTKKLNELKQPEIKAQTQSEPIPSKPKRIKKENTDVD